MKFDEKTYRKEYYKSNKEKRQAQAKAWYVNNKDRVSEKNKEYEAANIEERKTYRKEYYKTNKTKLLSRQYERAKERKQEDPVYKLRHYLSSSISKAFKKQQAIKSGSTVSIIGCSLEEFKQHIESQFELWMNWNNYGGRLIQSPNTSWDLDHIIPVSSAQTPEDLIRLNHYTNFKPLCSYQNRFIKRNK
jgi:hypothetical protein